MTNQPKESIISTERKREEIHTMMNRYQDNWFDVMFDKAIEALEREAEERGE